MSFALVIIARMSVRNKTEKCKTERCLGKVLDLSFEIKLSDFILSLSILVFSDAAVTPLCR
jgi:hypothetical protein